MRVNRSSKYVISRVAAGLLSSALVLAAVTAAVSTTQAGAAAKKLDLSGVTITVGGQNGGTGPIAEASGAYKNTPYKLQWTNEGTSTGEMTALESGAINAGGGGDLSLIFLQANQSPAWTKSTIPLTEVAFTEPDLTVAKKYPAFELLVGKNSGIKTLADLKGKKVAFAPGGDLNKFFLYIVQAAGLKVSDIDAVNLTTPLGAAALESGQVDAALLNNYYTPGPLSAGAKIIATSNDKGINTPLLGTTFVPTADLKNPKIVAALKDYLARSVRFQAWWAKNPDSVALAYVQYLDESPVLAQLQAKSSITQYVPITPAAIASEQKAADVLYKNGVIAHSVNVKIGFTTEFNPTITKALSGLK
jgi:sulfonate transport system substrate-binding protein